MAGDYEIDRSGNPGRYARRQVIFPLVRMNDVDPFLLYKLRDLLRAEHAEGIADRNVHKPLRRQEIQTVLPLVSRTKGNEYVVPSPREFATEIDKVPLAAAKCLCR